MLDPIACPPFLHDLIYPYAQSLHLTTLPPHIHEVLLSFAFYTIFENYISPSLSKRLIPQHYAKFSPRTKVNWDIHVTSFVQSLIICIATLYVIRNDTERIGTTWEGRLYGYSGGAGLVQAMAAGYFIWDIMICVVNFKILGPLDLLHGIVAASVAILGFRPFALYYGLNILLFELSTPFVNVHWGCDKVDLTGSPTQWYNGIVLIVTFFSCRVVWGSYLTINFFIDIWRAVRAGREQLVMSYGMVEPGGDVAMQTSPPHWMMGLFCTGNFILTSLNFFWFSKMIEAVRKRFRPEAEKTKEKQKLEKVKDR
jgi:TLC domain